jgi:uncharacterized protein YkwD
MKEMKKILGFVLCIAMMIPLCSGMILALVDHPSPWAKEQVDAAIAKNIVPRSLQSGFTQVIKRYEFCALAIALYETVTGHVTPARLKFSDTNDVNVEKAAALGIVFGVGNNRFDPYGDLTREQAATLLSRLSAVIGKPLPDRRATFADNGDVSSWALSAVGQVQAAGIMTGVGNNAFAPKGAYTREQSIVTFMRLYDIIKAVPTTGSRYVGNQSAPELLPMPPQEPAQEPLPTQLPVLPQEPAQSPAPPQRQVPNTSEFEFAVFNLVNIERANHGLDPLAWESRLAAAARNHSIDMAQRKYLSHICPDGQDVLDRIESEGMPPYWTVTVIREDGSWSRQTYFATENIAHGHMSPEEVVSAWMNSDCHRRAILSDVYTHIGVGFDNYYWTQTFGGFSSTTRLAPGG